jgi:hypothetical protein
MIWKPDFVTLQRPMCGVPAMQFSCLERRQFLLMAAAAMLVPPSILMSTAQAEAVSLQSEAARYLNAYRVVREHPPSI